MKAVLKSKATSDFDLSSILSGICFIESDSLILFKSLAPLADELPAETLNTTGYDESTLCTFWSLKDICWLDYTFNIFAASLLFGSKKISLVPRPIYAFLTRKLNYFWLLLT